MSFYVGVMAGAERFHLPGKLPAECVHVVVIRFFHKQRICLCPYQIVRRQRRCAGKIPGLGRVEKGERLRGDERGEEHFFVRVVRIAGGGRKQAPEDGCDFRVALLRRFHGRRCSHGEDRPP